nr:sulfatase [uncultured Carboxylicivirga sp.]
MMKLNRITKIYAFSLITICAVSCHNSLKEENKQMDTSRPNVVIFFLDDSGYGDLEHNGNPTIKTPNITKLADEGINFTQFYVASPACSASRYSLITGRYPSRSGFGSWVLSPDSKRYLHEHEFTLADGLKSIGYQTGIFGKWHMGSPNKNNNMPAESLPLAHGFDEWLGTNVSHDYNEAMLLKSNLHGNKPIAGYETLATNLPYDTLTMESLTEICTQEAISFIRRNKNKPFFAYIPYNMPHLGLFVNKKFKGVSRNGILGDVMEELDAAIGDVCNTLTELGIRKNTIIIFSSDNGPWVKYSNTPESKYGDTRLQVGYAAPFRDGKGSTYEGGLRVPGIISWPACIQGNRNEQTPISTLDILPTIFAITGVKLPDDHFTDGRDIRPLLMPDQYKEDLGEFKFFYSYDVNQPNAVRKGPWKLHIRIGSQTGNNYGYEASKEKPLLFQIEKDLNEKVNVADQHPEIVADLLNEIETYEKQIQEEGTYWDKK